jgi:citrate lyase subunit beta/citryl-CoA lyase
MTMKTLRSMLFVPGDSEKKLAKAFSTQADALILDLEDSVSPERLPLARQMVCAYLSDHPRGQQAVWVRINPLLTELALHDLAAVMPGRPDGILLPKSLNAQDVVKLDHFLSALETREGIALGTTLIIPIATEVPGALFELNSYAGASHRLAGMTWGAEDLATAVGASSNKTDNGEFDFTYQLARSMCLLAASHAQVQAIDTLSVDFRDEAALRKDVLRARQAGFTGKLAIHPDQVLPIHAGFQPTPAELTHAQRIVDAFAQAQGAGAVQLDGRMVDKPHLTQALRLLQLAKKD